MMQKEIKSFIQLSETLGLSPVDLCQVIDRLEVEEVNVLTTLLEERRRAFSPYPLAKPDASGFLAEVELFEARVEPLITPKSESLSSVEELPAKRPTEMVSAATPTKEQGMLHSPYNQGDLVTAFLEVLEKLLKDGYVGLWNVSPEASGDFLAVHLPSVLAALPTEGEWTKISETGALYDQLKNEGIKTNSRRLFATSRRALINYFGQKEEYQKRVEKLISEGRDSSSFPRMPVFPAYRRTCCLIPASRLTNPEAFLTLFTSPIM